jgi:hypothetical protein
VFKLETPLEMSELVELVPEEEDVPDELEVLLSCEVAADWLLI